ncbi:hypothetical protein Vadar_029689 [Vaccinium darrowii]|uniref:Uncharacterized protein n=1 Tax=Vaccinium darrowii TaxID=229202 RepID=A0ACB7ZFC7_9ERIC|nr:hypothetical protein Vadar_029689 [Vaccinium darrowii]
MFKTVFPPLLVIFNIPVVLSIVRAAAVLLRGVFGLATHTFLCRNERKIKSSSAAAAAEECEDEKQNWMHRDSLLDSKVVYENVCTESYIRRGIDVTVANKGLTVSGKSRPNYHHLHRHHNGGYSEASCQCNQFHYTTNCNPHLHPIIQGTFWQSPQKMVTVQNWTGLRSASGASHDDERKVHNLKPHEALSFTFRQSMIFPSSTMWNCSTNQGTFVAFKNDYDCNKNQNNLCTWRFSARDAHRYSPEYKKWVRYKYNPNYESLARGGVVKGRY